MTDCVSIGGQGDVLQCFFNFVRNGDSDSRPGDRIHSGHFMISCVNEDDDDAEGPDIAPTPTRVKEEEVVAEEEAPKVVEESKVKGYNFNDAMRQPSDSYQFGSRSTNQQSIDASLATLFKHMTLAYSGKISSPKWKNFRGIKVNVKDKIRLNNIIWREWHMQYKQRRKPVICQFEAPISEKTHSKPEAVVLEGKYWKRRLDCLTTEYKKWRLFFKNRFSQEIRRLTDHNLVEEEVESPSELLSRLETTKSIRVGFVQDKMTVEEMLVDDGDEFIDTFTKDTLFSSLNQPFAFPDPKEFSQLGIGDIIQPNLIQLQPSLDESMDTLAPLTEFNDFYDLVHYAPERYNHRRTVDATVLGMTGNLGNFVDPGFSSYYGGASSSARQLGTSPNDRNSSSTPNDEYIIDQISKQLMNETGSAAEFLTDTNSTLQQSMRTNDGFATGGGVTGKTTAPGSSSLSFDADAFFDDRFVLEKRPTTTARIQDRSFVPSSFNRMQPSSSSSSSSSRQQSVQFLADSNAQRRTRDADGFASPMGQSNGSTTGSDGGGSSGRFYPVISGDLQNLQVLLMSIQNDDQSPPVGANTSSLSPSSQVQWRHPLHRPCRPTAASSSHREKTRVSLEPGQTGSANCLMNIQQGGDAACHDCSSGGRRGSTGSLAPSTKGKKGVSFALPLPVSVTSKTKPRLLAPAPAPTPCDAQPKNVQAFPGAMPDVAYHNARIHTDSEHGLTILAQLLTQGKPANHFPDGLSSVGQGQGQGPRVSSPCSSVKSKKRMPGKTTSCYPVTSSATQSKNRQLQINSASSVSDFQKNLLIGAASHALGMEKGTAQEVGSSLFNSMLSSSDTSYSDSPSLSSASQNSSSLIATLMTRSRNPSNDSTSSLTTDEGSLLLPEHRRNHHVSAEQKRRSNIKYGFEALNQMIPDLNIMSSGKINKATTLQKAAKCCREMKLERQMKLREMDLLRQQIDQLQTEISSCQSKLPATGVPALRPQTNQMQLMFEDYVRNRTLMNWKFWIFSFIICPLFEAYNDAIVTSSDDAFCRSVLAWLQQQCSLVALRPAVLKSLRELSTSTSILSDPLSVPQEATEAVSRTRNLSGSSAT